jgi:NTP pyrophosphatase (non-canonical NTP hydrolase)
MSEIKIDPDAFMAALDSFAGGTGPVASFRAGLVRYLEETDYQAGSDRWMHACFENHDRTNVQLRCWRFIEEAHELVQALGCTREDAHRLVDYTWDRPIGEPRQEVGGVMVTLAALCIAAGIDMMQAARDELARVWTRIEKIRAKHKAKPKLSPLPAAPTAAE